jgi:hypothetical protein
LRRADNLRLHHPSGDNLVRSNLGDCEAFM